MGIKSHRILGAFNGRLIFAVTIMMLSQINFGMDLVAFNTTQAMPAFKRKFGVLDAKKQQYSIEPYFLSLLNSLTYVGQIFGVVTGGWISRNWGRRMSFFVMCFWALLAAILLVTAQTKEQMLAGRVINYIYLGQELVTVPVMQSEIVPLHIRGFVVGTYQLGTMVGSFVMAVIAYETSQIAGEASFRIPLGLFFVIPVVVLVGTCFIPESPRWFLTHDRHEDALESLQKYRQGRFTEEEIQAEFETQRAFVSMSQERGSFKELWQGTNLTRTLIAIGVNLCTQLGGQSFSSKYSTLFLQNIGAIDPFKMTMISTALFILVVALSMYLVDKIGRRPLLFIGSILQIMSMFVIGGLGTVQNLNRDQRLTITAMLTIYYGGYCFGWALNYHVITAEVANSRMRDMTMIVASCFTVVAQFLVSFTIPYLYYEPYAALGPKIGLIFGSICVLTLIFAFLCVPECRNFSLEEIDYLFNQKVPLRKFGTYKPGHIVPVEMVENSNEKSGTMVMIERHENVL